VGAAALVPFALATSALPPLPRSVSTSRQFIVYCSDVRIRAALCNVAERTKAAALALIRQPDQWKRPIVVNAQPPHANLPELPAAAFSLAQTEAGLKLQLDLIIGDEIDSLAIEHELLRAILIEMMYRTQPNVPAGATYLRPPDWLVEGVLAWASQLGPPEFGGRLRNIVFAHKVVSLQDFLRQRPDLLDSPSLEIYRSYSYALVALLRHGNELATFMADLPHASGGTLEDLILHFKNFGGSIEKAERVWNASVTQLVYSKGYESLSVSETERRLEASLQFQFLKSKQPEKFWKLEDYPGFIRVPGRAIVLTELTENLMALGVRANPVCRAIVLEYQQIAARLARGNTRGIERRLARLQKVRQTMAARAQQIDDYMNWFEATQSTARSETFVEYFKAAERIGTTSRHDPISGYLDFIETQFGD
jgi:hypothetical protein